MFFSFLDTLKENGTFRGNFCGFIWPFLDFSLELFFADLKYFIKHFEEKTGRKGGFPLVELVCCRIRTKVGLIPKKNLQANHNTPRIGCNNIIFRSNMSSLTIFLPRI